MSQVKLLVTYGGLNYIPILVAKKLGFYQKNGIDVDWEVSEGKSALARLASGEVDMCVGGIWRSMLYNMLGDPLVTFARLCNRLPMYLIGRKESENINGLKDLEGKALILPAGAPSPWVLLQGLLRKNNVNIGEIKIIPNFSMDEAYSVFVRGLGDYIYCGEPCLDSLIEDNIGKVHTSMPTEFGPVPWSVFYTRREFFDNKRDVVLAFRNSISEALNWVIDHSAQEIVDVTRNETFIGDTIGDKTAKIFARFQNEQVWHRDINFDEPSLENWQQTIYQSGLVSPNITRDIFLGKL